MIRVVARVSAGLLDVADLANLGYALPMVVALAYAVAASSAVVTAGQLFAGGMPSHQLRAAEQAVINTASALPVLDMPRRNPLPVIN